MTPWVRSKLRFVLPLLALLLAWQALSWFVHRPIVPGVLPIGRAFLEEIVGPRGTLLTHLGVSAYRVITGIVLAAALGTPLGLAIGTSAALHRMSAPLIYLTYPIPKIVFLPLFLLFFGLGDASKVAMIAVILFFQVLIVMRDAAGAVRQEMVQSVRSLGASRLDLFRYVYFPASLPALFSSLRLSAGTAIAVLFFVESFGTQKGLGIYILTETWARAEYARMYAGVLTMGLLGVAIYFVLDLVERRMCAWVRPA